MKIIGHRGARGLATENTLESFQKAIDLGVDGIEFDVWTSKDGVAIVNHDEDLLRMTGRKGLIPELTYEQISQIRTLDGKFIPTADQVMNKFRSVLMVVEIKDRILTEAVTEFLQRHRHRGPIVISYNYLVLAELKKLFPELCMFPLSKHPLQMIKVAQKYGLEGIGINSWSLNPIVYWLAKRHGLEVYIYPYKCSRLVPADNFLYLKIIKLLGFKIGVATDFPDKIVSLKD